MSGRAKEGAEAEDRHVLPSQQWSYEGLPALSEAVLYRRREGVFLLLAGLFLGSLVMLNILGISRFLDLAFFVEGSKDWTYRIGIAVGVLPYPLTFLCTDFISELYGRRRASAEPTAQIGPSRPLAVTGAAIPGCLA